MSALCFPASRIHVAAAAWQCFNTVGSISFRSGSSKINELLMTHICQTPAHGTEGCCSPFERYLSHKNYKMKHIWCFTAEGQAGGEGEGLKHWLGRAVPGGAVRR